MKPLCRTGTRYQRLLVTCHDFRVQVVAATATLYMCLKLHGNPLERVGIDGQLLGLVDRATLFPGRATNDNEPVLEEDVCREECRLLHALSYELITPTVQGGLRSFSSEHLSSHVQLVRFFSDTLLMLLESSLKSCCSQCTSRRRLLQALQRSALGCAR